MADAYFKPALFKFLKDLAANNDRDWFQANSERYEEQLRQPALRFIEDFGSRLATVSPHFVASAKKSGGSLFRIHRDVRFSHDKSPYKTYTGIQFRHEAGKNAHAPGFYLHLQPKQVFVGVGTWRPDTETVTAIRNAIAADPAGWKKAVGGKRFNSTFEMAGESLKRPPRGFDADHPLIEEIKRKDFIAVRNLSQAAVCATTFDRDLAALFRTGAPLMRFLCAAAEVPF
jgi:uncharacterized protein (TIGR02453 family)